MLNYLKKETENVHREVEKHNLAQHIMDHSITTECYERLLIQNYYYYRTIEQELWRNKNITSDLLKPFFDLEKSEKLLKDIKAFNTSFDISKNPVIDFLITSEIEAIGALYVIEGSMLGGLLISKHISKCIHLKNIKQHHFFSTNPKHSMHRWETFAETINQLSFTNEEKEKAVVSAKKSFLVFNTEISIV